MEAGKMNAFKWVACTACLPGWCYCNRWYCILTCRKKHPPDRLIIRRHAKKPSPFFRRQEVKPDCLTFQWVWSAQWFWCWSQCGKVPEQFGNGTRHLESSWIKKFLENVKLSFSWKYQKRSGNPWLHRRGREKSRSHSHRSLCGQCWRILRNHYFVLTGDSVEEVEDLRASAEYEETGAWTKHHDPWSRNGNWQLTQGSSPSSSSLSSPLFHCGEGSRLGALGSPSLSAGFHPS